MFGGADSLIIRDDQCGRVGWSRTALATLYVPAVACRSMTA
jgi:hypothetical protein